MNKLKSMPQFKNADEEHEFWADHDVTAYFEKDQVIVNPTMPNLKPSKLKWRK